MCHRELETTHRTFHAAFTEEHDKPQSNSVSVAQACPQLNPGSVVECFEDIVPWQRAG